MRALIVLCVLALLCTYWPSPSLAAELVPEEQISSVEERRILVSIEEQYDKLTEREAELDNREIELKTLEREVDKKLAAMQDLRDELTRLLNRKKEEEGRRVAELSAVYEKMEPRNAAVLIKDLDLQLAVDVLVGMKKKVAGEIFDNLDPETATALSKAFTDIPVKDRSGY